MRADGQWSGPLKQLQQPLLLLLLLLCLLVANSRASADVLSLLRSAGERINSTETPHCYHGHSGTKAAYLKGKYRSFLEEGVENTLVYPFCLITRELGNKLGNFFTEVGCAELAGLHFVAVHKQWDLSGSHTNITSSAGAATTASSSTIGVHKDIEKQRQIYHEVQARSKRAFLEALPDVIVHPNPVKSKEEGFRNVQERCKCTRYCWGERQSAWINATSSISRYLRKAIGAYLETSGMEKVGTILSADTDLTNAQPSQFLPVVPEVALQYRCGDNIGFSYMYGVLPFRAFLSRIPKDTRVLYVLSDHPSRATHSPYSNRCQTILQHLFDFLKKHWPQSTIVIKRGGDMFLDYARLAFANTTICSASTYCFWPAIASLGQVHFPLSGVIAGADTIDQAPDFGPRFHWIVEPKVLSDFRKFRPWTNAIDALEDLNEPEQEKTK